MIGEDNYLNNHSGEKASSKIRLALLFLVLILNIISIWGRTYSITDEPRVAGIAWEMVIENDYIVPRLNGKPFLEYPQLGYIPAAILFKLTGVNTPFVSHISTILAGMGTVLLTFLLGRLLGGEKVGLLAALFLQTTFGFIDLNSQLLVDASLTFWITLSLLGFTAGYYNPKKPFPYFTLFYLGMAGGFLTKGLLGIGFPAVIVTIFIFCKKDFKLILALRPWWGILIFAFPILVWMFGLYQKEGTELLYEVFRQSIYRFTSSSADHAQPPFFYIPAIFYLVFPWTFFLPIILWRHYMPVSFKNEDFHLSNNLLPKIWFATVVIVLTIASAKRVVYLGPIYPSFALMAALWWKKAITTDKISGVEKVAVNCIPYLGLLCLFAGTGLSFANGKLMLGISLIGLSILLSIIFFLTRDKFKAHQYAMIFFLFCYVPSIWAIHHTVIFKEVYDRSFQPFFNELKPEWKTGKIILFSPAETLQGSTYLHLSRTVPIVGAAKELKEKIEKNPDLLIIGTDISLSSLNESLSPNALKILRRRDLKNHEIMLLSVIHPDSK